MSTTNCIVLFLEMCLTREIIIKWNLISCGNKSRICSSHQKRDERKWRHSKKNHLTYEKSYQTPISPKMCSRRRSPDPVREGLQIFSEKIYRSSLRKNILTERSKDLLIEGLGSFSKKDLEIISKKIQKIWRSSNRTYRNLLFCEKIS